LLLTALGIRKEDLADECARELLGALSLGAWKPRPASNSIAR